MKFLGSYVYQLDDKGRVSLPAAFRREAPDQRFVLVQAYAGSLALYPESEWGKVEERLLELRARQPQARMYVTQLLASAMEATPDSQGRILIPANLRESAGLEGQALLVGTIDKIEVWNPSRFEEAVAQEEAQFEQYAPQIFR